MFFGLQPIKQERNSSISGSGGGNVNRFNVSYAPPLPNSKVLTNLKVGAQLTQGEKKQLTDELVKFGTSNDRPVRDGQYLKLKALLDYKKDQFNDPLIPQDQKKTIFNEIERLMTIGNQLKFIGAGESGRMQTAATFLGVGYDKIQVKAPTTAGTPPVKPEPTQTAETNSVTGTQATDALSNTPAAVDPQVAVDVQTIGSKMANVQDKKLQSELAGVALTTAKPDKVNAAEEAFENAGLELKAAEKDLGTSLADLSSRYVDGLSGNGGYENMKKLREFQNNPALDQVVQDVATLYARPVSEVQDTHALALFTGFVHKGKNNPAAKELAERLLAALQKPVAASQTESNVESGSQVAPDPSGDGVPIDGVLSEYA
ncbi:MAG: hypothetical protein HEQ17_01700 [Limnohabitans sp.]|jgi:hypothetical protein|uniref:hypothetical protein n=1 Tax=Limnohabitans sp. TaxID=1907725 RepID=UPI0025E89D64|nr:hypothetical protein [Limnohabitans sp.]MCO4087705.1 hypothetical protein [Limnohabitans sp.]